MSARHEQLLKGIKIFDFIINYEKSKVSIWSANVLLLKDRKVKLPAQRKLQGKNRPVPRRFVFRGYAAADAIHQLAGERQSQSRAVRSFGGEERIEDALQVIVRNP